MSSRVPICQADRADAKRLFRELAQMEPVEVDFRIFRDNEMRQLMELLTRLLNHIHEQSEHEQSEHEQSK